MPAYETLKPQAQAFSRPNFQFGFYPSLANLNLPPIIAQTLEMAAAAPSPPLPLQSAIKPLNSNAMPMTMTMAMSNENNVMNADIEPSLNDPTDEEIEEQPDEPPKPTESLNSMNTQNSVHTTEISDSESSTNANSLATPSETAKEYRPIVFYGNPLYQSSFFNQYNTYVPYFMYPFRRNLQSRIRKNRYKSKRNRSPQKLSLQKSSPAKTIVINIT